MSPRKSFLSTIFFWNGIINPKKKTGVLIRIFQFMINKSWKGQFFFVVLDLPGYLY